MTKEIEDLKKIKSSIEKMKPSEKMAWQKFQSEAAKNIVFPHTTAFDLVYEENKNRKDNIAIGYGDKEISYGEFFDSVAEVIDSFKTKVNVGEIVSVASLNTPELVYLFYGLGELHAITNMIDPRTSYNGILDYIKEADSSKLLLLNLFSEKFKSICDDTKVNEVINVSLKDSAKKLPLKLSLISSLTDALTKLKYSDEKHTKFADYIKSKGTVSNQPYDYKYSDDLPLTIVHTGGTTGVPKGVLLSHYGYNAMAWQYKYSGLDLQPGHRFMNMMPPFIAYGSDMFHMPFVMGMRVDLIPIFDPKKFDRLIHKYKPNHFAGVPNHLTNLNKSKVLNKDDLSYIITAAVGGDGISPQNHKKASEFLISRGAKNGISPGYAMTEANSVFSVCVEENFKYGSAGFPLPGATVGIFDEKNNELDSNELGQICLHTPTKMLGYYKNEEETKKSLQIHEDGKVWVHTGDLGYIDDDGHIWVTDRIKNMIIRHDGFKVYPSKIEDIVNSHPAVDFCKVVGITDFNYPQGQKPKVHIKLKPEYIGQAEKIIVEISIMCKDVLAEYAVPEDFKIREEFPLTPIGKIDARSLQKEDNEKENSMVLKK